MAKYIEENKGNKAFDKFVAKKQYCSDKNYGGYHCEYTCKICFELKQWNTHWEIKHNDKDCEECYNYLISRFDYPVKKYVDKFLYSRVFYDVIKTVVFDPTFGSVGRDKLIYLCEFYCECSRPTEYKIFTQNIQNSDDDDDNNCRDDNFVKRRMAVFYFYNSQIHKLLEAENCELKLENKKMKITCKDGEFTITQKYNGYLFLDY